MSDGLKRQVPLMLRTSKEERDELDGAAQSLSMPTGTWARSVLIAAAREIRRKQEQKRKT